jgi:cell division protein FtsX
VQVAEVPLTDAYERLASLLAIARRAGAALVALLLLVGVGAVVMSVALGIDARREEIEIMRLVGATRGFIGAPYVVSSCLVGVAGAFAAAVALALRGRARRLSRRRLPRRSRFFRSAGGRRAAGLLAAGVAVAAGGSPFGPARRLRA